MTVSESDKEAITAVVEDYFQGMYHSDTDRLARAFHADARITGYDEGKLINNPITGFIKFVGGVSAPADDGEAFDMQIEAIDMAGEAAAVKVRDLYKGLRFTDFLTLLKFDEGWRIVNKTFHHEPRE